MKRLLNWGLIVAAILVFPGLVQATHLTEIRPIGDCDGWSVSLDVHFRSTVYQADLDFIIYLLDDNGAELEHFAYDGVISRDPEAGPDATYYFDGLWQGYYEGAYFTMAGDFHLYAPWGWGDVYLDEETQHIQFDLECTVPADEVTWDGIKSLYR